MEIKTGKGSVITVKRVISTLMLALLSMSTIAYAEETAFSDCKLTDAKGKQADAKLIFSDDNKRLEIRVSDRNILTVPYENLDKFSYDYSKKHRVTEGALVMVASLGAGAIVMLTQSKSHWLYIDYHEQNLPKEAVLRMDKKDYKKIFDAVKTHTGKDVEYSGEAAKSKAKEARKAKEEPKEDAGVSAASR